MMSNRLVLNFLVFADRVAEGELQADLLQEAADLGFSKVEIRREYFQKIDEEIPVIQSEATRLKLQLFYSVPDEVYIQGKINPKLEQYHRLLGLTMERSLGVKYCRFYRKRYLLPSNIRQLQMQKS